MADEITLDCSLLYEKNGVRITPPLGQLSIDVAGNELVHQVQLIGITEEAIYMGSDVGTPGIAVFKNLDPTNFISIRRATGEGNFLKILPGEHAVLRLVAAAPFAIADTAACRMEYWIFEV